MHLPLFLLLLRATPVAAAPPLTVDQIVARHVEARGGKAALAAVHSLRLSGKFVYGNGDGAMELQWHEAAARPGRIRDEMTLQGLTQVDAYDGHQAWSFDPFRGRREAQHSSADATKGRAQDADIDGPLVDWQAKGHRVESLGTEDVDGTPALKLRVLLKDGDTTYIFLDPDYFLEIREVHHHLVRGTDEISQVDLGNYTKVGGVWMPFSIESGSVGQPASGHYSIERAETNTALDDALFTFPNPPSAVKAAIGDPPPQTGAPAAPPAAQRGPPVVDSGVLSGLGARNIGSAAMSGRVSAVAGHVADGKTLLFVGAASGGVWKSPDNGTTFRPVFDRQPVQSIGAIAIDPTQPKTVWVGTGESWTRNSVSVGDGIYRSDDEGETWKNVGLPNSERINRILINPKKPSTVYACVPGKLWSDSPDRGVYRTTDGGATWKLILKGSNLSTGCSGLSMDPTNPDILLAGLWDFRRKGWTFRSGGEGPDSPSGSALFRTINGGEAWTEMATASAPGLPPKPWGRVEVAIAPSDAKVVYALIESKNTALFRSGDGGHTWEARDSSQMVAWRPFYFGRLVIDPTNPDRLFKPDLALVVSEDGGRSFAYSGGGSHGDWHDLWIDPTNPKHIVGGDDGGLWISFDGGSRWWKSNNLPISQFYHVTIDKKDPYQVYGGLQDNSSWAGDSSYPGGITNARWENLFGGDGFCTVVDPSDPEAVYAESQGGYIGRVDRRTHVARDIQPKAGYHEKLRFNWNTPIAVSPTDPKTLYLGAQFLFRSHDRGDTWERISPDLTTNDPEKQKQEQSGGVTVDNSSAEMHTTIFAISESPLDAKVIWAGTDDGNVQLSRDAGKHWTNVVGKIPGLPPSSWVSSIEASRFEKGAAYATFDRHTFGDLEPWVYRTSDFGATWTRIVAPGSGVRGYAHVIREDVVERNLLFLGTEFGLWISVDGGAQWGEFKGNTFPSVAVRDLVVHPRDHDLVIATHGRGIWIIDDLTPLRKLTPSVLASEVSFVPGRPVQQVLRGSGGWVEGDAAFVGDAVSGGATITYYQRSRHLFGPLELQILDGTGKVIDSIPATKHRGLNRVAWSMAVKPPRVPRAASVAENGNQGPRVLPGNYTVRLTKGATVFDSQLAIGLDRRATYGVPDRKEQFAAAMRVHHLFGEESDLVARIEGAVKGAEEKRKALAANDPLAPQLGAAIDHLSEARKKIVATKEGGAITGEERIREHTDILYGALMAWEGRPGKYQVERIGVLEHELDDVKKEVDGLMSKEVHSLNERLRERHLDAIPTALATEDQDDGSRRTAELECLSPRQPECIHPLPVAYPADRDRR